jgi:hypothetical protein
MPPVSPMWCKVQDEGEKKINSKFDSEATFLFHMLSVSVSKSILREPCELVTFWVCSESGASVNRVVVVVAKAMAPFDRDVLPADVFDSTESGMDCMVMRRVSSELTPRPTRTMISVNCTEGQDVNTTGGRQGKVFRDNVRRCPECQRRW